jgi:hypothetical protein
MNVVKSRSGSKTSTELLNTLQFIYTAGTTRPQRKRTNHD